MIDRERLTNAFCELVRIDSPSGEEEAMARELQERLEALGFTIERDPHGNLIASESRSPSLILSAHMDTVEPGRGIQPIVDGDQVRTDGTTILGGDCKAGIAAILESLYAIKEEGIARIPIQLVFTRGEEIGLVGAKNLDFSLLKAKEALVFDGNGPVTKVTTATPTHVGLGVHVTGRAAHAGVEPEKGLSAIKIAAEIITQLPQGRIDDETTLNVGTTTGGTVRNAVPEEAAFAGEFRSRNAETLDLLRMQILGTLEDTRKRYPDAVIQEEMTVDFERYSLPEDDPLVTRATRLLLSMGLNPELGPSGGGTDANIFNQHGIRCVVVGMSTRDMHTTREYVEIPDLVDTARFCYALLTDPTATIR